VVKGLLALILGSASLASAMLVGIPAQQVQASDRQSPAVIRNPDQYSQATQSVVLINDTDDWVTYELNGQRFQLRKGESRPHRVGADTSPEVKFDQYDFDAKWNTQAITLNLIPGRSYTFKRNFDATVGLY